VAVFTLPNSANPHRFFAPKLRPLPPPNYPNPQREFLVFPTGKSEYHWRIVALATNRTMSRHQSPSFALRKCLRLNQQRRAGATNETN
jgi:hypothetical protein